MSAFALALLCLIVPMPPIGGVTESTELADDVYEIETRDFKMPLQLDPGRKNTINAISLFVSDDRGKSWKHVKDYLPRDDAVDYSARKDGLLWFTLQVAFKDGSKEPATRNALTAAMKVYVNSERKVLERKVLKPKKSYEELDQEAAELRKAVAALKKKLRDLEPASKPK